MSTLNIVRLEADELSPHFRNGLKSNERVHTFATWNNLNQRLGATPDSEGRRAIYAQLTVGAADRADYSIQVAYTRGIADEIDRLVTCRDEPVTPATADSAIFYSVSAWENRAQGTDARAFIREVAGQVAHESPQVNLVTLSPLPDFRKWVFSERSNDFIEDHIPGLLNRSIEQIRRDVADRGSSLIVGKLASTKPGSLDSDLAKLAAAYVVHGPCNVAHLHCKNGAHVLRLCIEANPTERGLGESFGIMANYMYKNANFGTMATVPDKGRAHSNLIAEMLALRVPRYDHV